MSRKAPFPDPHAPRLRVRPPANWINDPNGPFRWRGRYHLFYQHNPAAPVHANVHWGHVSSPDLVRWDHHPIALTPTPGGPDEAGCWSGCVVDDDGVPTAVYTGIDRQHTGVGTICLARAVPDDDALTVWRPVPEPVVTAPPAGLHVAMFRDPFVFRHGGRRWALVGAGHADGTPSVLLYDCDDLLSWRFAGVLLDGRDPRAAEALGKDATGWECPQLFETSDGHWVLVLSLWDGEPLSTGHLTGTLTAAGPDDPTPRFTPRSGGPLDHGRDFYAPAVLQDRAGGRVLLWGWSWEARSQDEVERAGWAGVLTAPRVVDIRADGALSTVPAPELERLRARPLPSQLPDAYELFITATAPATVGLLRSAAGERVTLALDPAAGTVTLDRSGWPRQRAGGSGPLTLAAGPGAAPGGLTVRVLADGSLLELFAGDAAVATERVYRRAGDVPELTTRGTGVQVTGWELSGWEPDPPRHG
ncbi:glycoside hydrolase family 32 protein [Streptomyces litchfieldiae]|uniref:beta-fructofuranosidase n=1 Tax=Streptomyces litchfieldiae TaxID=3075543 RepID=A0ABU2MTV4_9ACTN|nr:glycoside hydrolase family 32 protein [Streptomyces sp. DSM 44938]MDT0345062.1 glycoside hydrolase family 32 protein [Streptomyces sp. DSM 44938]